MEMTASVLPDKRSLIPAVTHIDGSTRPQTITREQNPLFAKLLEEFCNITGLPLLLNTSFNLGGQPIVESPEDAIECFINSELDALVIGDTLVRRAGYPQEPGFLNWTSASRRE